MKGLVGPDPDDPWRILFSFGPFWASVDLMVLLHLLVTFLWSLSAYCVLLWLTSN